MAKVTNVRTRGMLGFMGHRLEPGQSTEVDASPKSLKKHPFVQEGWIKVEKGNGKKQAKEQGEKQEGSEAQNSEFNTLTDPTADPDAGSEQ